MPWHLLQANWSATAQKSFHSYLTGVLKTLQLKAGDVSFLAKSAWNVSSSSDVARLMHSLNVRFHETESSGALQQVSVTLTVLF